MALKRSVQRTQDYRDVATCLKWAFPDVTDIPGVTASDRGEFVRDLASELARRLPSIRTQMDEMGYFPQSDFDDRINDIVPPVMLDMALKFDKKYKALLTRMVAVSDEPQILAAPPHAQTQTALLLTIASAIRTVLQSKLKQEYEDRFSATEFMRAVTRKRKAAAGRRHLK